MRSKTTIKKCGTCQYWTGNRDSVFDSNDIPKVDIFDNEGICENVMSKFCDQKRKQKLNCKNYSKWTELL